MSTTTRGEGAGRKFRIVRAEQIVEELGGAGWDLDQADIRVGGLEVDDHRGIGYRGVSISANVRGEEGGERRATIEIEDHEVSLVVAGFMVAESIGPGAGPADIAGIVRTAIDRILDSVGEGIGTVDGDRTDPTLTRTVDLIALEAIGAITEWRSKRLDEAIEQIEQ